MSDIYAVEKPLLSEHLQEIRDKILGHRDMEAFAGYKLLLNYKVSGEPIVMTKTP